MAKSKPLEQMPPKCIALVRFSLRDPLSFVSLVSLW
jgi:hypothetical protein